MKDGFSQKTPLYNTLNDVIWQEMMEELLAWCDILDHTIWYFLWNLGTHYNRIPWGHTHRIEYNYGLVV